MVTGGFDHAAPGTPRETWTGHDAWRAVPVWTPPDGPASLLVVAAHPDDESLGAGGAVARLAAAGWQVAVVVATDGEGSHPGSPTTTPAALASRRRGEAEAAVRTLGTGITVHHLGLPDGGLEGREDELVERLVDLVGVDGDRHTLLAPWSEDPHPDHRAAGRAARQAAHRTDALLLEYPIWAWHQLMPDDLPWERALRLELDAGERRRKAAAIAAHASQVRPLSDDPRDAAVVTPGMLTHFSGEDEIYLAAETGPPPHRSTTCTARRPTRGRSTTAGTSAASVPSCSPRFRTPAIRPPWRSAARWGRSPRTSRGAASTSPPSTPATPPWPGPGSAWPVSTG